MAGHTSICGTPQVSKYCYCLLLSLIKQRKNKQKKENSSVRGCSGIGTRKTKKMIFFQGLNLDECKTNIKIKTK